MLEVRAILCKVVLVGLLLLICNTAQSREKRILTFKTNRGEVPVVLTKAKMNLGTKVRDKGFTISRPLVAHFNSAEEYFPLIGVQENGRRFLVLGVREPSQRVRPMGYCGAGFEDYVLLIEMVGRKAVLVESSLLASCMKSISLISDSGGDPSEAIRINSDSSFSFQWSKDPDESTRTARIKDGRLIFTLN